MVKEFMNLAIREALIAYKKNEVPVGAVIVDENNKCVLYEKVCQWRVHLEYRKNYRRLFQRQL